MYEHMIGWEDNFNLADPSAKPQIAEATYYMTDQNGKKGVRVMHVERPIMGKWTQNFNVQQILDKFLGFAFPQLYKQLRYIAGCRECATILELLIEVVTELEAEEDKKMMKSLFEDAERSEWGKHMHDLFENPFADGNVSQFLREKSHYNTTDLMQQVENRFRRITLVDTGFNERVTIDYGITFVNRHMVTSTPQRSQILPL